MATVGPIINDLLQRLRDPNGIGHSRLLVRTVLSRSQQLVSTALENVIATATLTLEPRRGIYNLNDILTDDYSRVLTVQDDQSRDLAPLGSADRLALLSRTWIRQVADQQKGWTSVGHSLLIIYPVPKVAKSFTVVYPKVTDDIVDDDTTVEIPDEDIPLMTDLAEAFLLLRDRQLTRIPATIERMARRLGISVEASNGQS